MLTVGRARMHPVALGDHLHLAQPMSHQVLVPLPLHNTIRVEKMVRHINFYLFKLFAENWFFVVKVIVDTWALVVILELAGGDLPAPGQSTEDHIPHVLAPTDPTGHTPRRCLLWACKACKKVVCTYRI